MLSEDTFFYSLHELRLWLALLNPNKEVGAIVAACSTFSGIPTPHPPDLPPIIRNIEKCMYEAWLQTDGSSHLMFLNLIDIPSSQ